MVPDRLVEEVRDHVRGCPTCYRVDDGALRIDTRRCSIATMMIERGVNYLQYMRRTSPGNGVRR